MNKLTVLSAAAALLLSGCAANNDGTQDDKNNELQFAGNNGGGFSWENDRPEPRNNNSQGTAGNNNNRDQKPTPAPGRKTPASNNGDNNNGGSTPNTDPNGNPDSTDGKDPSSNGNSTPNVPNPNGTDVTDTGNACSNDGDCQGGKCLNLPGGYCTTANCGQLGCPDGSACYQFDDGATYCLKLCTNNTGCRDGYACDADGVCWTDPNQTAPGTGTTPPNDPPGTGSGNSPVGGACNATTDCKDPGAVCYPATSQAGAPTGFVNGYCIIFDCSANSCPTGSKCVKVSNDGTQACVSSCDSTAQCRNTEGYACFQPGICFPGCGDGATCPNGWGCDPTKKYCVPACTPTSCPTGKVCGDDGTCQDPPCTAGSCGQGMLCAANGECVPDVAGGPGPGPGPTCSNLPKKNCDGTAAYCTQLMAFEPANGTGYTNYPLNGETWDNQWRSYARRDLQMLIKWATAYVDCKGKSWGGGNGHPLGLGDMSEANGAIPGTAVGQPGHPANTHVNGNDMDIAYYQNKGSNNYLKSVCNHTINGADQYHCVGQPTLLDLWRTTLFIGALLSHDYTRVIGVDGKIGPLVEQAMPTLCANGWLPQTSCQKLKKGLAYEVTNGGAGWYAFHHHHLHISMYGLGGGKPGAVSGPQCLIPGCGPENMTSIEDHAGCVGDLDYTDLHVLDMSYERID